MTDNLVAQNHSPTKQRLDFAKTYFEYGASYMPSFDGWSLLNGESNPFTHASSLNQYLTWGGFHFWGHAEFYVTIPLKQGSLSKNEETQFELLHSVATGGRFYPWAVTSSKIRPYVGVNWGGLDFQQKIKPEANSTKLSKDFMLNYELGFIYNYKSLGFRIGANYFKDNKWLYPISKSVKAPISTPSYSVQLGILCAFDASKNGKSSQTEEWNSFPRSSPLSYNANQFGNFFLGVGPSSSYSLAKSTYNQLQFPFLKDKLLSKNYFDISLGYQFNKANLFAAVSYRNPKYETSGFGVIQNIEKKSLALELNKYLTDYSGFAPYVGLNLAFDNLKYKADVDGKINAFNFPNRFEPGFTFGWDIVPGKTSEAIILRTNLRWFPFSDFDIDGKKFNFSQLEYNLIQVVFYPGRL
ncbi:MAG TPA: hypothetical protein PLY70_06125 [Saprospiraceae bacterium]|nr:hypothetical protein [Saprospiraceae bacterium]